MKIIFKPWIEIRIAQIDKNDPTLSNLGIANQTYTGLPPEWSEQTNSWQFDVGKYLNNKVVRDQLQTVSFDMYISIDDDFKQTITIDNFKGTIPDDLKLSMIDQAKKFRFKLPTDEQGKIKKETFKYSINFNDPFKEVKKEQATNTNENLVQPTLKKPNDEIKFRTKYPFMIDIETLSKSTYDFNKKTEIYLTNLSSNTLVMLSNSQKNGQYFFLNLDLPNGKYYLSALDRRFLEPGTVLRNRQDYLFETKSGQVKIISISPKPTKS